ncbi:MAG: hypothetical protein SOW80_10530 [Anaerovoracaceae bacterium]|nr:hypothetical protein [Anaerovoracaceae bacterium]
MKPLPLRKIVSKLCIIFVLLLVMFVISTKSASATTQYVTLDGSPGTLFGGTTLYKNAACTIPYTYTDSSGVKYTGILGKNLYMAHQETIGTSVYKVQYGTDSAYVQQNKTKLVSSLPSSAVKLVNRKQITIGVHYAYYTPWQTYVVYENQSTGKVAWAMYCNDTFDSTSVDAWIYPPYSYAYLNPMS